MPSFRGSREMAKSQRGPVALAAPWCENGVWKRMLEHFADDPDMENGMVDSPSHPLWLHLTAGQRHDIIKAHDLTVDLAFEHLIADRSYGAKDFILLMNCTPGALKWSFHPTKMPKRRANTMHGAIGNGI